MACITTCSSGSSAATAVVLVMAAQMRQQTRQGQQVAFPMTYWIAWSALVLHTQRRWALSRRQGFRLACVVAFDWLVWLQLCLGLSPTALMWCLSKPATHSVAENDTAWQTLQLVQMYVGCAVNLVLAACVFIVTQAQKKRAAAAAAASSETALLGKKAGKKCKVMTATSVHFACSCCA